jgi:hypothetical protein
MNGWVTDSPEKVFLEKLTAILMAKSEALCKIS